jgi:CDK inhibitor PHO81
VAACLLDLSDLSRGLKYENPAANDLIVTRQLSLDQSWSMRPYHDLESSLRKAVQTADATTVEEVIRHSDTLAQQPGGRTNVTRILWKAVIDSPPKFADLILSIASNLFDFNFVDDINGRTCLHQAAMVGMLRLVNLCLDNNVPADKVDVYGRSALHYAAMNGHADICRTLLKANVRVDLVDMDNLTPLVHATLKGSLECVRVLIDEAASPTNPPFANTDISPLSLASRAGHLDVVAFLIECGAENKPNDNGEYPIHLAAKEGHVDVCRFLIRRDGWDLRDKYHEWTPLFHAVRYGHTECLRLFLEAGAQVDIVDELGQLPIHYAAWHGHNECTTLLLGSSPEPPTTHQTPKRGFSPTTPHKNPPEDVDMIPSLHLPPPIMPYRFYGHNYLDKNCLVQITIGDKERCRSGTKSESVKLYPSFMAAGDQENYLNSSPLFKIVITAIPDTASGPFSIPLPLRDQPLSFAFQAPSIDTLRLDFSVYPNFGTKTIGRAVALPALLKNAGKSQYVLPILDHKLHLIGEVRCTPPVRSVP